MANLELLSETGVDYPLGNALGAPGRLGFLE
jgi:hypothetical protein